ncbi:MAG: tyrosine-type recombinase/integrase [Azoarcus sp.]|nr:tyrosine-type recombinase/integrase [Azoarcus sp.]
MPRKRNPENAGLPARWRRTRNAYYYQVPPGLEHLWDGKQTFKLGNSLPEAYKTWAERINRPDNTKTIAQLLDRYALEVVPTKAASSRGSNVIWVAQLRKVFGEMPLSGLKPQHIYRYVDMRSMKKTGTDGRVTGGRTVAHREVEILSHAFTKAVEWGYLDRHPFKGEVRLAGEPPRDRYVEDWEVLECLALAPRRSSGSVLAIQAYIRIKLMTGMARSDLLRLTTENLRDDGIHIQRHKTAGRTGKRTIYVWTQELRDAVAMAEAARPCKSLFLFCNRRGEGYINEAAGTSHGWDSMWQRFMDRVLTDTKIEHRFTEHDLRAKCASDATSLEHARALLSHADSRTTDRIYRRKAEVVKPLGGVR